MNDPILSKEKDTVALDYHVIEKSENGCFTKCCLSMPNLYAVYRHPKGKTEEIFVENVYADKITLEKVLNAYRTLYCKKRGDDGTFFVARKLEIKYTRYKVKA